jgi:hypothetical protein
MSLTHPLSQISRRKAVWGPKRFLAALIIFTTGLGFSTPSLAAASENHESSYRTERQQLEQREKEIRQAIAAAKSNLSNGARLAEDIADANQQRQALGDVAPRISELEFKVAQAQNDARLLDGWSFWLGYADIQTKLDGFNVELRSSSAGGASECA